MAFQEEERAPPEDGDGLKKKTGNSRAAATKAKLKAAVAASTMLHAMKEGADKTKKSKSKEDKEKERRRRRKKEAAAAAKEAEGSEGSTAAAKLKTSRPGDKVRRSREGAASTKPDANEYPEARGIADQGMRYA